MPQCPVCDDTGSILYRRPRPGCPAANNLRDCPNCKAKEDAMTDTTGNERMHVRIDYTNHRGERAWRTILPYSIAFTHTGWHPEPQWLLAAFDVEKQAERDFALKDIHAWEAVK